MDTVQQTDEALLLSGDLEDFGRFYDRYVSSLLAFFQRRVGNPEVAADLTAETFAAAMSRGSATWPGPPPRPCSCSRSRSTSWPTITAAARRRCACAGGSG
jgi:DNA-directed RNA polymerase specialized sigma24 family protein